MRRVPIGEELADGEAEREWAAIPEARKKAMREALQAALLRAEKAEYRKVAADNPRMN